MSTWDDKPNDYEHALKLLEHIRNETREECARVVEGWSVPCDGRIIAGRIRALKSTP